MIIQFLRRPRRTLSDEAAETLVCSCGRHGRPGARHCRRCGEALGREEPAAAATASPAADKHQPSPTGMDLLPIPTGATARVVRARREASRPRPRAVAHRLAPLDDELSARRTLAWPQIVVLRSVIAAFFLALVINVGATMTLVIAFAICLYLGSLVFRLRTFARALADPQMIKVSDEDARAIWDRSLPMYTVLVPAYREPEVIGAIITQLDRLEYPRDRLDIKLLLEADDQETLDAARAAVTGRHYEIIEIPYAEPRTKPKALNVGLRRARGRPGHGLVTIYDVEDRPDPLQLRRAVVAFRRDPSIACLQAKLAYYNADQNIITRWFTIEYAMWFNQLLPGLVSQGAPIPLGGTSNHFQRAVLESIGGWDAFNVTEDADLGIRLHRAGYRSRVLDSVTEEEANSDFVNWVKQRSRWYKGYLQTWLVHMRHPAQLWRELGPWGFVSFSLFVAGTPLLTLLNPIFWSMTVFWFLAHPAWVEALFPAWIYYASLICLVFGNLAFVYTGIVSARATGRPSLVLAATVSAGYWMMMSIAAIKAFMQLVNAPTFWEKTFHGLDRKIEVDAHEHAAA
jgi:cellulose synthase/poly-beta-1,6-N-acetylglucosamine synthase-like glycosyltransferase